MHLGHGQRPADGRQLDHCLQPFDHRRSGIHLDQRLVGFDQHGMLAAAAEL
jgi:hypothetical protein